MDIFIQILGIVVFSIVVLVLYNVVKTYLLTKVKINKWVVLGASMVIFVVPMIIWPNMPKFVANYVIPGLFVFLFLWFMDLSGFMKKKNNSKTNTTSNYVKKDKKPDVVIRPKAKPNRAKNKQK